MYHEQLKKRDQVIVELEKRLQQKEIITQSDIKKNQLYNEQLHRHQLLLRQQEEQINRIEQLQKEILRASQSSPRSTYNLSEQFQTQNPPQSDIDFKANTILEKSSQMIENITLSQRQFQKYVESKLGNMPVDFPSQRERNRNIGSKIDTGLSDLKQRGSKNVKKLRYSRNSLKPIRKNEGFFLLSK